MINVQIDPKQFTPEMLAEMFWGWDSEQQAQFFRSVSASGSAYAVTTQMIHVGQELRIPDDRETRDMLTVLAEQANEPEELPEFGVREVPLVNCRARFEGEEYGGREVLSAKIQLKYIEETCPECKGTGEYVGFNKTEPCRACR